MLPLVTGPIQIEMWLIVSLDTWELGIGKIKTWETHNICPINYLSMGANTYGPTFYCCKIMLEEIFPGVINVGWEKFFGIKIF